MPPLYKGGILILNMKKRRVKIRKGVEIQKGVERCAQ
jgi:hypothetical protein